MVNWTAILPQAPDQQAYAGWLEWLAAEAWLAQCCLREGY